MNKTTEALAMEALNRIADKRNVHFSGDAQVVACEALAAIREVLAESKPAPDGRIPKTVFTLDDISKAAEMGRHAGMIDALAEPVKQEPVAFVKENPFCPEGRSDELTIYLPVGTALYAAPVDAKAIRAEALEEAAKWFEDEEHPLQPKKVAAAIRGLK